MQIIPAIDLKDGQCVRLKQGRMEDDTVFSTDVVATATRWVEAGASRLHIVDLDGAFAGEPRNGEIIRKVCEAHPTLKVQVGGGIRYINVAASYLEAGVSWVIIGTQAVKDPTFVERLCQSHPNQVIVGLDARNGEVALSGWAEDSGVNAIELAKSFEGVGVASIIYTDIERDGMMQGFNSQATADLAAQISIPVFASGGVNSYEDIDRLCQIAGSGVAGAIVGRAMYEGSMQLDVAQSRAIKTLAELKTVNGK